MKNSTPSHRWNEVGPEIDSFYHLRACDVSRQPCAGTACFVARNTLGMAHPASEPRVSCLGRCFAAPATGVDRARPRIEVRAREGIVLGRLAQGGDASLATYHANGGGEALARVLARPRAELVDAIDASALRGRGGAGFPAGKKWRAAAAASGPAKFVVANADEGDAGAFIDRFLMEGDPHALLEGMTAAAYAIGAQQGFIYLRQEYPFAKEVLETAIAEARAAQLLGDNILGSGFAFDVELFVGHGSYVCGEETALLRSLEGLRPEVMARPPYAAERGLYGCPTLIQNVETLATVPWIIVHGGEAYRALGFSRSRGTKALSLNSLFARPGLYEVEFGVTVRHIVEELGGGLRSGTLKGVIIGGPLAGIVPPALLDTPLGFEELHAIGASVGHGGVVAFDESISIADLLHHVVSFGAYESCGKCTPCHLGSRRLEQILARHTAPDAEVASLVAALRTASLCGHGAGIGEFATSALAHFGKELAAC